MILYISKKPSLFSKRGEFETPINIPLTTTYERNYIIPCNNKSSSKISKETVTDCLWNCKPLGDFAMEYMKSSKFKSMDDYMLV